MADFRKFPEERDRLRLSDAAAADLARELIAAAAFDLPCGEEGIEDRYQAVFDDPADWPAPPPAFVAPLRFEARSDAAQSEEAQFNSHTKLLRDPDVMAHIAEERLLVYPEHIVFAALWLSAVGLGLWRWMA